MNIGNFFWDLAKMTIFNPQMWLDMATILGPVFLAFAVFVWWKIRHLKVDDGLSEEE